MGKTHTKQEKQLNNLINTFSHLMLDEGQLCVVMPKVPGYASSLKITLLGIENCLLHCFCSCTILLLGFGFIFDRVNSSAG